MRFDRMAYGARVKQLRISKGLTQEQLAEKIHISRTYAVKIESGAQVGSVELAVELAEIFDVSLDFLLLGKGHEQKDKKQELRRIIALLSALEAEL